MQNRATALEQKKRALPSYLAQAVMPQFYRAATRQILPAVIGKTLYRDGSGKARRSVS
jgi:hypothetical protein